MFHIANKQLWSVLWVSSIKWRFDSLHPLSAAVTCRYCLSLLWKQFNMSGEKFLRTHNFPAFFSLRCKSRCICTMLNDFPPTRRRRRQQHRQCSISWKINEISPPCCSPVSPSLLFIVWLSTELRIELSITLDEIFIPNKFHSVLYLGLGGKC